MRWTLVVSSDVRYEADGEGVWSWHPWAGAKSANDDLQATVTNKVMDTGESTLISRNTIAQGRSGVPAEPVVTNSRVF
jgi:hypothetical protein